MSARSILPPISPEWFQEVRDASTPSHVGQPNASTEQANGTSGLDGSGGSDGKHDWIVRFSSKSLEAIASAAETQDLLAGEGVQFEVIRGLGIAGQVLVRSSDASADWVADWLANSPHVAGYELDGLRQVQTVPDDTAYGQLWGLENSGQTGGTADADVDAAAAWDISVGSSSIVVGVIDTGVDYTHEDLAANVWINPGEVAGNGIDDDGNGFIDDLHGYDFVNNDGDPMDDHNHGTHVSGTIAAAGNNGLGVVGLNWTGSIMGLKFLSAGGSGYTSDAVRAINYATMMRDSYEVNVRVTNNSWGGGGFSSALNDAIAASGEAGILFAAAAGNNGSENDVSPHYPSNYDLPNVISVAATDHRDDLAYFSNYGAGTVHLAAPGVSVYSTVAGGGYASYSGTSMATPHVAGVAALGWSVRSQASVAEIRTAILQGADPLASLIGRVATGGRLNAYETLRILNNDGPSAPFVTSLAPAPNYVAAGTATTMVARGVMDFDGTVTAVSFYQDSNADGRWDQDDLLVGTDATVVDSQAEVALATDGLAVGTHTYFARGQDNDGQWGGAAGGLLVIVPPDDHGDDAAGASAAAVGGTTAGVIGHRGEVDFFAVDADAGVTYVFRTVLAGLPDSVLTLYDRDGSTALRYNDDVSWPGDPSSRITWTAPAAGTYYLEVAAYGSETGQYGLEVIDASTISDDHGNGAAEATAIAAGGPVEGQIEMDEDVDWFAFEAVAGNTYLAETTLLGLPDSVLYLYDQDGTTLIGGNDDVDYPADPSSRLSWTAPVSGTFYLAVEAYGSLETGQYSLLLQQVADDHGGSAATATDVAPGSTTGGSIQFGSDADWFAFQASRHGRYVLQTTLTGLTDSVLYLWGGQGGSMLIDYSDDVSPPGDLSSRIDWTAQADGTYYLAVQAADLSLTGGYELGIELVNFVPVLEPVGDRAIGFDEDAIDVPLAAADADGDPLAFSAQILATGPLAQLAYDLDQQLGLYRHSAGYFENFCGVGEKFMVGTAGWYYILPNGEFYAWRGSLAASPLVDTLDAGYHADPTLLHDALRPTVDEGQVTLSVVGDTLTIDPVDGYVGTFQVRVVVTDATDTVSDTFEVRRQAPNAVDLGTIDYLQIADLDLSGGDLIYLLQTGRDGFLSVQAASEGSAGGVQLTLYDDGFNPLAAGAATSAGERVDWEAGAGETYYVGLAGDQPNVTLRLANLVEHAGLNLNVYGTDGDDTFEFSAGEPYEMIVNGFDYQFVSSQVSVVTFTGGLGANSAVLTGSAGNDVATMYPDSTTLYGSGYRVELGQTSQTVFHGGGGADTVRMYDSPGDDCMLGRLTEVRLTGDAFQSRADGFQYAYVYATAGGTDRAELHDSAGDDYFSGDPTSARLYRDGVYCYANSFDQVQAYSTAGGSDRAFLYDSAGDDVLVAGPTEARLSGEGYSNRAEGFDYVFTYANSGGNDRAELYDSAGDDNFFSSPEYAGLYGDGFYNYARLFRHVSAYATAGGTDRATMSDSAGDDTFVATPGKAQMFGDGFHHELHGFSYVYAYSIAGGNDRAELYDSAGDDVLTATPTSATLSGNGYSNRVSSFRYVYAHATAGGSDRANLHDSAGNDAFVAKPTFAAMFGGGFFNRIDGFDNVYAYSSSGGADQAFLYDSAGDDVFQAHPTSATLSGEGFYYWANRFRYVNAYSTAGGTDRAALYDSAGDDVFSAGASLGVLAGGGFYNRANGFRYVNAYSTSGGTDRAHLYDSAGDDVFGARPAFAAMCGGDFYNRADGFRYVNAHATSGGADRAYLFDSAGDDVFAAKPAFAVLCGGDFYNRANGFRYVKAYATAGGHDAAFLFDSAGNDVLVAQADFAVLCGSGFYNWAQGFDVVDAYSANGGSDARRIAAVDFLLRTHGQSWQDA